MQKRECKCRTLAARLRGMAEGNRFSDKNLQLALLDEIEEGHSWLASHEADYEDTRGSHPTWPTWAAIRDGERTHNAALEEYLLTIELPESKLAAINTLTLNGERDLYGWVFAFWWESGDGDHFKIRSFEGLEHCTELTHLVVDQKLVEGCSLSPLQHLKKLESLTISASGNYVDIDALLKIPNLKKLELEDVESGPQREEWDRVVDLLCQQGLPSLSRR
jgi:hypothetical protein